MPYLGTVELKASDIRRIDITSSTSATHTLTWTAPNEQSLIVTINGVKQQNNYTVSGTTLTLDTALGSSDLLEVIGINDVGTTITPAQGSVDTDQMANDAITSAKIADGAVANADLADMAANTVKVRDANSSGVPSDVALATTEILIGDGTGFTTAALSSDVTMTNAGAVTIADNAVSLAKMAGLVRGKIIYGDASGDPAALTVGGANEVLTSDGTDIAWASVGITDCSQWRLDTTYTNSSSSDVFFTANLAETTGDGYGRLGSAMTESSGVFTFPSTGYWMLESSVTFLDDVDQAHMITKIFTTTDDSAYDVAATSSAMFSTTGTHYASAYTNFLFDVTSTSTHKVKMGFKTVGVAGGQIEGSGSNNCTFFTFTRLADT